MKPYKQPVNATYGAPMGRHSDNPANFDGLSVTLSAVHLIDGYDDGGAYWGIGTPLFCAIGESDEEQLIHYFRQPNRAAAVTYLENYGAIVVPESPDEYLETMTEHYIIAALWSSTKDDGSAFDDDHYPSDVDPESRERCKQECKSFIELAGDLLKNWSPEQAGYDFWLSRNGHGSGFFDRDDLADAVTCNALQRLTDRYGSRYCFTWEDRNDGYTVGIE